MHAYTVVGVKPVNMDSSPDSYAAVDNLKGEYSNPVFCIFWSFQPRELHNISQSSSGILSFDHRLRDIHQIASLMGRGIGEFQNYSTELDMFRSLGEIVRKLDPDVLLGWDLQDNSWDYIIKRSSGNEIEFEGA